MVKGDLIRLGLIAALCVAVVSLAVVSFVGDWLADVARGDDA